MLFPPKISSLSAKPKTQAVPMLFPMYTVVADVLLKMTKVETPKPLNPNSRNP